MKTKQVMVNDLTIGNPLAKILTFAIPIFIGNMFQQLYNVVDIAVIGHVLGDHALAAVGATTSIYSLIIGFINGMSNGFCVVIARYFGGNEHDHFQKAVYLSIFLSFITTIAITVFLCCF